MVKIKWTEDAIKDLEKLDKPVAQRVIRKISWLCNNFERVSPEPLGGEFKGTYKLRIGDWRAIYTMEGQVLIIQFIGHRKEIYKTL